jgi:hypothetical protein
MRFAGRHLDIMPVVVGLAHYPYRPALLGGLMIWAIFAALIAACIIIALDLKD